MYWFRGQRSSTIVTLKPIRSYINLLVLKNYREGVFMDIFDECLKGHRGNRACYASNRCLTVVKLH